MVGREEEIRSKAREIFLRERLGAIVLGGPILVILFAALWGYLNRASPDSWAAGVILAGFFVGILVRVLGRGTRTVFYLISIALYIATILFAVGLFDVMSKVFISTRLLLVVAGMGISAACGLVAFGLTREDRWALRDNRGLDEPEEPGGFLGGMAAPLAGLSAVCVLVAMAVVAIIFGSSSDEAGDYPMFGEPSASYWKAELARDPVLAEDARRNGVGYGLDGSDEKCHTAVQARHEECEFNLCMAERQYVLAGCLETAEAVREDAPIRW